MTAREGFGRSLYEAARGSAAPAAYLQAPPMNLLYGGWHPVSVGLTAVNPAEQYLFPGFMLMGLAAIGLWHGLRRRETRSWALAAAAIAGLGLSLSLGPERARLLYALVDRVVFGFQAIRAPARFAVLVLFGLASLAALGVRQLVHRDVRAGRLVTATIIGLLAIEYANALPIRYVPLPRLDTSTGRWLRDAPGPGAVLYWPLVLDPGQNTTVMLESLQHGRPIVNGYSGQRPAYFQALTETLSHFPDAESVSALHTLGVRFVVTRQPVDTGALPLIERMHDADGVVYEIHWTAEAETKLLAADTSELPPTDRIPFRLGETATYSVVWTTGPLTIPAGRATLRVASPADRRPGYALSVVGTTAPWLSRFFQADDQFSCLVDRQLRPLVAEEHFHEGHRTLDREMVFDRSSRQVRIHQKDRPEIALPISREALDPVSALYYLRSLPLVPGATVQLRLDDAGRNLIVDVRSVGIETIQHAGAPIAALRVEPAIRDQGRQPIGYDVALWRSLDVSRVPLRIEVSHLAGVGTVRLELQQFNAGADGTGSR